MWKLVLGVQDPHMQQVLLHLYRTPDPTRRQAVISGFHLRASFQMHQAFSVLAVAEGFEWQKKGVAVSLRRTWPRVAAHLIGPSCQHSLSAKCGCHTPTQVSARCFSTDTRGLLNA